LPLWRPRNSSTGTWLSSCSEFAVNHRPASTTNKERRTAPSACGCLC
jgi:hypothetical protein